MKQNVDLEGMRAFVTIAEMKSITRAADKLGTSKSTISRRLEAYENAIGVSLFRRSTRSLSLTELGSQHFEKARMVVGDAQIAIEEMVNLNNQPAGQLRLSGSLYGGQKLLMPYVWRFMEKYPKVIIDMVLTDNIVDLITDGIDFTLRMGDLEDSELLARRVGKGKRIIVASPDFLHKHFQPQTVQELKQLPAIITAKDKHIWRFASGESASVSWIMSAGAIPVAVEGALRGFGIALVPEDYCLEHLANKKLIHVLPHIPLPAVDISLVYPRLRHQNAAAKAFLQEMRQPLEDVVDRV